MVNLGVAMSSSALTADTVTSSRSLKLSCIKHWSKLIVPEDTGVTLTCGIGILPAYIYRLVGKGNPHISCILWGQRLELGQLN